MPKFVWLISTRVIWLDQVTSCFSAQKFYRQTHIHVLSYACKTILSPYWSSTKKSINPGIQKPPLTWRGHSMERHARAAVAGEVRMKHALPYSSGLFKWRVVSEFRGKYSRLIFDQYYKSIFGQVVKPACQGRCGRPGTRLHVHAFLDRDRKSATTSSISW